MWLHIVLASLLALDAKAFVAAPIQRAVLPARTSIQWAGLPARRFILTPTDLEGEVKPQSLTIRALFGTASPAEIPTFIAQPDKTINLADAGLCIEASGARSGDVVRLNRCTGSPEQLWITSRGSNGRIQLEGTEKCINVDAAEGDPNGALVDLRECEDKTAQSWMLEEHIPLPTQSPAEYPAPPMRPEYPAPSMRHVSIALISVVALTALSFSIWWRRRHKAPAVAMSQGGCTLNVDHGGICVAKPLPVRNVSLTPAVMALSPGSTDLESHKKLTLSDLKASLEMTSQKVYAWTEKSAGSIQATHFFGGGFKAGDDVRSDQLERLNETSLSVQSLLDSKLIREVKANDLHAGRRVRVEGITLEERNGKLGVLVDFSAQFKEWLVRFDDGQVLQFGPECLTVEAAEKAADSSETLAAPSEAKENARDPKVNAKEPPSETSEAPAEAKEAKEEVAAPEEAEEEDDWNLSYNDLLCMSVPVLRQLCKDLGLEMTGRKIEVVERLYVVYQTAAREKAAKKADFFAWTKSAADDEGVTKLFGDFNAGDVVSSALLEGLTGTSLSTAALLDSNLIRAISAEEVEESLGDALETKSIEDIEKAMLVVEEAIQIVEGAGVLKDIFGDAQDKLKKMKAEEILKDALEARSIDDVEKAILVVEDAGVQKDIIDDARKQLKNMKAAQFVVVVTKGKGDILGIQIACLDGKTVQVLVVDTIGLISEWNKSNPFERVQRGDRIIDINGYRDDAAILKEIRNSSRLRITVEAAEKPPDSSETPAEEKHPKGDEKLARVMNRIDDDLIEREFSA